MNKMFLTALTAAVTMFATGQAAADFRLNGTQINGLPAPGPILQGTQVNGLPTPGPILQGTRLDGVNAGPVVRAIQAHVAPNWSALPAAQLQVHLPSSI